MEEQGRLIIGLLSHYFKDDNLGCVALSICNLILLDRAAEEAGVSVRYRVLVNEKQKHIPLPFTKNPYEYRVYSSCKQSLRHPLRLISTRIFAGCDLVFNLCAGDGFTDLYGLGRVLAESYMTILGSAKGARMILAPQTIGPFSRPVSRLIARHAMKGCAAIFARDERSAALCREMGFAGVTSEVIDVALALPYETKRPIPREDTHVGIGVSGLLCNRGGGFRLRLNYKALVEGLVERLLAEGCRVHLIAHVIAGDDSPEDDYTVCQQMAERFPGVALAPKFTSPIEAKSYIAGMDFFTGARMHAAIAALSSGVPVVPIAYSRKFGGLFDSLGYRYYIDAATELGTAEAADRICAYLHGRDALRAAARTSRTIWEERLEGYTARLVALMKSCRGR